MKRILVILDRTPAWTIIVGYLVMAPAILVLSVVAFFFPILPVCMLLHKEFSNLGPIATFFWGLLFDIVILTPVFMILLLAKIGRVLYVRFVVGTGNQGRSQ